MQSLRKKRLLEGNEIPLPNIVGFGKKLVRPASKPKPDLQRRAENSILNNFKNHPGNIQDHFQKFDKSSATDFSLVSKDLYSNMEGYPLADEFDEQGEEEIETADIREHDKDQKV